MTRLTWRLRQMVLPPVLCALVRFARWAYHGQFSDFELAELNFAEAFALALMAARDEGQRAQIRDLGRTFAAATRNARRAGLEPGDSGSSTSLD
jgi:hypothetical protein